MIQITYGRTGGMAQVVECLPSKSTALCSSSSTTTTKGGKKKEKKKKGTDYLWQALVFLRIVWMKPDAMSISTLIVAM
jgi:hypothetical protein